MYGKIDIKTHFKDLIKRLEAEAQIEKKVVSSTIGDIRKRSPAWVAQEVMKRYNIKKNEIVPSTKKDAPKRMVGSVKMKGETIDKVAIIYAGRSLTPVHFKMKPNARPKAKTTADGKKRKAKKYTVTSEVVKGKRTVLKGPDDQVTWLAPNPQKKSQTIAWYRTGMPKDSGKAIAVVKRTSLPQMIDHKDVRPKIEQRIISGLAERLEHNAKRLAKR